jgi:lipopolysaccharide export LptBFGC system permease protein LptF
MLNPFVGMWLPNIIIAAVGCFFLHKNAHFR